MEIKEIKQTKVFGKEIKTNLKSIGEHVQVLPEIVMNEMTEKGFQIEGPQVWVYNGADGKPDTQFDLLVGFPVADDKMDHNITALENFKCVTIMHKGSWANLGDTYCLIIGQVMQNGCQMTGECREIYHKVDFDDVEKNITEVQIGIK